jgi:hypothetical protein
MRQGLAIGNGGKPTLLIRDCLLPVTMAHSPQWNAYFPAPETPGEHIGSVGTVEASSTGAGGSYLRRFRRHEDGSIKEQLPDPETAALLIDLVMLDIHSNYWGTKIYARTNYDVAADISNAAFPQTWPPYESRPLKREDEQLVLTRRGRGLVGDPVTGRPNEEEKLYDQRLQHLDDRARQRDLPILYDL